MVGNEALRFALVECVQFFAIDCAHNGLRGETIVAMAKIGKKGANGALKLREQVIRDRCQYLT
jgi:hypothetical protein